MQSTKKIDFTDFKTLFGQENIFLIKLAYGSTKIRLIFIRK